MGELMKGCTLPGRMISWAGVVCFGDTTDTAVTATCEVSTPNFRLALTRDQIPDARRAVVMINAIARISQRTCVAPFSRASLGEPDSPATLFATSICGDIVAPM